MKNKIFVILILTFVFFTNSFAQDFISSFKNVSVKGEQVQINEKTGTMVVSGNVSVTYKGELRIFTDKISLIKKAGDSMLFLSEGKNLICYDNIWLQSDVLNYFVETGKMFIRGEVKVVYKQLLILTDVFEVDLNTMEFEATAYDGRVVSVKYLPVLEALDLKRLIYDEKCRLLDSYEDSEPKFLLSSKSVKWEPELRTLVTEGRLELAEQITKNTISADRFRVLFSENLFPQKIRAFGNFVLEQPNRRSASDRAEIDLIAKIATLKDNVKITLTDGSFNLETDVVDIYLDEEKPLATNSTKKIEVEFNQ